MFSSILEKHEYIFMKPDFPSNTQSMLCMILLSSISISLQFFCQDHFPGGHLASITSQHIHLMLMELILDQNGSCTRTWVGGLRYLDVCMFSKGMRGPMIKYT